MFFRKSKRKTEYKKRGFTLAESVLALTVISIASVGTLSLVLSSQRATISAAQKQQAQLYATDIINCYRVSDTYNDFANNVNWAIPLDNTWDGNPATEVDLKGDFVANLAFDAENEKTLTVTIQDSEKQLTELTFTKGVALQ